VVAASISSASARVPVPLATLLQALSPSPASPSSLPASWSSYRETAARLLHQGLSMDPEDAATLAAAGELCAGARGPWHHLSRIASVPASGGALGGGSLGGGALGSGSDASFSSSSPGTSSSSSSSSASATPSSTADAAVDLAARLFDLASQAAQRRSADGVWAWDAAAGCGMCMGAAATVTEASRVLALHSQERDADASRLREALDLVAWERARSDDDAHVSAPASAPAHGQQDSDSEAADSGGVGGGGGRPSAWGGHRWREPQWGGLYANLPVPLGHYAASRAGWLFLSAGRAEDAARAFRRAVALADAAATSLGADGGAVALGRAAAQAGLALASAHRVQRSVVSDQLRAAFRLVAAAIHSSSSAERDWRLRLRQQLALVAHRAGHSTAAKELLAAIQ
jgi:hypothetical protein